MIPLTLAQIAEITSGQCRGDPAAVVTGEVVIDSRRAGPGGLFAAVAGERADGHDFAAAAVAAGAVAVLATRPVPAALGPGRRHPGRAGRAGPVVAGSAAALAIAGITGSSGKTSTKDLTAQLVERLGPTVAPAGSFNNELGHPLTVLRADEATRYLVLELSARGPGTSRACARSRRPARRRAERRDTRTPASSAAWSQVARAKGELRRGAARRDGGVAILNADDPRVMAMAARTEARVVTFGRAGPRRRDSRPPTSGWTTSGGRVSRWSRPRARPAVPLRLHGAHHVPNALAAAAIARELGLDLAGIADGPVRRDRPQPVADGGHRPARRA